MISYPDHKLSAAHHLLFDIGYSYALLWEAERLLTEIAQCGDYPVAVDALLEQMAEFKVKRLALKSEIYDNAEEAARKGGADR